MIGLCCAHFLHRGGAEVTLVERGGCGQATSSGNAGWITRMLSEPLPAPGVVVQALKWMLKPESPLLVRPRMDRDFFRWSWRFARHCSAEQHRRGTEALVALNASTLDLFDGLRDGGVEFEMHQTGLLFLALTEAELLAYASAMRVVQAAGHDEPFEILDRASVLALEPSVSDGVIGGIFVPSERHVRPESLASGLAKALASDGVEVLEHTARIPFGEVSTYTEMALAAGSPRAVRAAGSALGSNPLPVIVPCHRVLRTGGGLGGYGGGLEMKSFLLGIEGFDTSGMGPARGDAVRR